MGWKEEDLFGSKQERNKIWKAINKGALILGRSDSNKNDNDLESINQNRNIQSTYIPESYTLNGKKLKKDLE